MSEDGKIEEAPATDTKTAEKKEVRKKWSNAKRKFTRIANQLKTESNKDTNSQILPLLIQDLETAYRDVDKRYDDYINCLDSDDEDDKRAMDDYTDKMETTYDELCKCQKLIPLSLGPSVLPQVSVAANVSGNASIPKPKTEDDSQKLRTISEGGRSSLQVKVKKLDAPTFDGDIRSYPSFKRDYERHMVPTYGKDPYALKKCLSGEAVNSIKGVDDDYDEMMRRLDNKFGRAEKLSDAIISELRKLKPVQEGDTKRFIELVEIVEDCWLDMKRLAMGKEMSSITVISEIEKLIPAVQLREWVLMKQKLKLVSSSEQFDPFLQFLISEKEALEYMTGRTKNDGKTIIAKTNTIEESNLVSESNRNEDSIINKMNKQEEKLQRVIVSLENVAQVMKMSVNSEGQGRRGQKCWYHESDTHETNECTEFAKLALKEKLEMVRERRACFSCLKTGHQSRRCNRKVKCTLKTGNNQDCTFFHHKFLHEDQVEGTSTHVASNNVIPRNMNALLMINKVSCLGQHLTTLWDPGSNVSLITKEAVKVLGVKGKNCTLKITKAGNVTDFIDSTEYIIPLKDKLNTLWWVTVYEIADITAEVKKVCMKKVSKLFKDITEADIKMPSGKVQVLIGTDCSKLLPNKVQEVGNLALMQNMFGYCLRGSHPDLSEVVDGMKCNNIRIGSVNLQKGDIVEVSPENSLSKLVEKFTEVEGMGIEAKPVCGACKCGNCFLEGCGLTMLQQQELSKIESGLSFNKELRKWTATMPWIIDPATLPNNVHRAVAVLKGLEKRMRKAGTDYMKLYEEQFQDMVTRKVARKLSQEEISQYTGPVFYLSHFEVNNPEKTTKMRIVCNASATYMQTKLNDCWVKGPLITNDLLGVLLRFREKLIAIVGDLSKISIWG